MATTKPILSSLVTVLRTYGNRLLTELKDEEIYWIPTQTQGRSIHSYFLHLVNAEIYWLKKFGFSPFEYLGKDTHFNELMQSYDDLEKYLIQTIQELPNDQLEIITPIKEGDTLTRYGTFGWMIWRTSFHAIHHFAQIAYLRFTQGNPPPQDPETSWSKIMDQIIMLNKDSE